MREPYGTKVHKNILQECGKSLTSICHFGFYNVFFFVRTKLSFRTEIFKVGHVLTELQEPY